MFQFQPLRLVPFLTAILLSCCFTHVARGQQLTTNQGTGGTTNTGGGTTSGNQAASTAGQATTAENFALQTDISQLTQEMATGFVGTDEANSTFLGVAGAGENANTQADRRFTSRTPGRNVNQGTQTQPIYRTFGANNVPYRAPHKIAFQITRPADRSIDLTMRPKIETLTNRRPEFQNVEFEVSAKSTVTLRGTVGTERERRMAMLFAKMEPGVKQVVNELQVSSVTPIPLTPPAGAAP